MLGAWRTPTTQRTRRSACGQGTKHAATNGFLSPTSLTEGGLGECVVTKAGPRVNVSALLLQRLGSRRQPSSQENDCPAIFV